MARLCQEYISYSCRRAENDGRRFLEGGELGQLHESIAQAASATGDGLGRVANGGVRCSK